MVKKIFIYGVPGTGKTYLSKILSNNLGLDLIEGDVLKKEARHKKLKNDHPFLYLGTCLAYSFFGELNQGNVIKGLQSVRKALSGSVLSKIEGKESYILEAAFLDPNILNSVGKVILLTTNDESLHRNQFLSHIEKILDFRNNEFNAARIIQKYLIEEASKLNIQIIDSEMLTNKNISEIMDILSL